MLLYKVRWDCNCQSENGNIWQLSV